MIEGGLMKEEKTQSTSVGGRWAVVVMVLVFLSLISFVSALIIGVFISTSEVEPAGNIAHIQVIGTIMPESAGGILKQDAADSQEVVRFIKKASENPEVKAILLEIDSPGGTPVASYEIADALRKANKTTVAWIREVGASGAYWVASSADHIIANPMSIVGSVGVTASYLEFEGTLHRYNASYRRLVSGDYKDIGSPFKEMTSDEEQIMQEVVADIQEEFLSSVVENRELTPEIAEQISDGRFYTGKKALKLGLIDELGGKEEAVKWIEKKENITAELAEYKRPKTLAQMLTEVMSEHGFYMGQGIGSSLTSSQDGARVST
jgi:protease-4